jgi:hypothetical protein
LPKVQTVPVKQDKAKPDAEKNFVDAEVEMIAVK